MRYNIQSNRCKINLPDKFSGIHIFPLLGGHGQSIWPQSDHRDLANCQAAARTSVIDHNIPCCGCGRGDRFTDPFRCYT